MARYIDLDAQREPRSRRGGRVALDRTIGQAIIASRTAGPPSSDRPRTPSARLSAARTAYAANAAADDFGGRSGAGALVYA